MRTSPGLTTSWSIRLRPGHPDERTVGQPDEDELRSFLLSFRKFTAKSEPVYIPYIHNVCQRCFTNPEHKEWIRLNQEYWRDEVLRTTFIQLVINNRPVHPEEVADLWINGYYFHDDHEKSARLQALVSTGLFVRAQFLDYLIEATNVIIWTAKTIEAALNDGAIQAAQPQQSAQD